MGGGYYDREIAETTPNSTYSAVANEAMSLTTVHPSTLPANRKVVCTHETPIVLAMDVTRSRGDDSKILYDKLPMMYGQMMIKNYIPDPALSFAAIGDAACGDIGPLQVCDFAAGNDLDDWIKKLWLEEGGGGTGEESYELAALYYAKHSELKGGKKGFFFVTGDEAFYTFVNKDEVKRVIGDTYPENISSNYIWKELERKYNVFFLYPRKDMTQRHADIDAEIAARLKREGAKTGDVAISLAWDSRTDLDLHVITPNGEEIYYSHKKSKCNGELDVDMNVRGESETPVENVYWPTGKAPAGKYTVMVHLYAYHGTNGTPAIPFRVQVKVGEEVKMYKSTIKTAKTKLKVCDFEFNPVKKDPHAYDAYSEEVILEKWRGALLPGRILILEDPKAIVDTILGVLSVFSGSRTIEQYVADLQERGQSETRISQVKKILGGACLKEIPIEDDV